MVSLHKLSIALFVIIVAHLVLVHGSTISIEDTKDDTQKESDSNKGSKENKEAKTTKSEKESKNNAKTTAVSMIHQPFDKLPRKYQMALYTAVLLAHGGILFAQTKFGIPAPSKAKDKDKDKDNGKDKDDKGDKNKVGKNDKKPKGDDDDKVKPPKSKEEESTPFPVIPSVAVLVVLIAVVGLVVWYCHKKRQEEMEENTSSSLAYM